MIPTNTTVVNGKAVMGAGVARLFAERYPFAKYLYGVHLTANHYDSPVVLGLYDNVVWVMFPTKHSPSDDKADLGLIKAMLFELDLMLQRQAVKPEVVMPMIGCGCGKLRWAKVEQLIKPLGTRHDITIIRHNYSED